MFYREQTTAKKRELPPEADSIDEAEVLAKRLKVESLLDEIK